MDSCAFPLCEDTPTSLLSVGPHVAECFVGIGPTEDGVVRLPLCAAHADPFRGRDTAHVAGQDVPCRVVDFA